MKLSKFLLLIGFFTCLSLLYVYQQTEIFRVAYIGQKKIVAFEDLLERNTLLRYNVGKNASLVRIGNRLSNSEDFQIPDTYRLVRLTNHTESLRAQNKAPQKESLFSRIFGIKRQAEARTINP